MYLANAKFPGETKKSRNLIIAGAVIIAIFGFTFIGYILNMIMDINSMPEDFFTTGILIIPGVFILLHGLKIRKQLANAREYGAIFNTHRYGFLTAEEISSETGKSADTVMSELTALLSKGYIVNLSLRKTGNVGVQLEQEPSHGFQNNRPAEKHTVICGFCGGKNEVLRNRTSKCEYCGSDIKG